MYNISLIKFKKISSVSGNITPIEAERDIPFKIRRIYYIYGVDEDIIRGYHAHRNLHQVLICVNGSVKIKVKTFSKEEIIELKEPSEGLYIGPMIWREMFDFSKEAVLVVLASDYYNESDYIRDYSDYVTQAQKLFNDD